MNNTSILKFKVTAFFDEAKIIVNAKEENLITDNELEFFCFNEKQTAQMIEKAKSDIRTFYQGKSLERQVELEELFSSKNMEDFEDDNFSSDNKNSIVNDEEFKYFQIKADQDYPVIFEELNKQTVVQDVKKSSSEDDFDSFFDAKDFDD